MAEVIHMDPFPNGRLELPALLDRFHLHKSELDPEGLSGECPINHGIVSTFDVKHTDLGWRITFCELGCLPKDIWEASAQIDVCQPGEDDGPEQEPQVATKLPPRPILTSRMISLERAQAPPVEHFIVGVLFPFGKCSVIYGPQGAGKTAFLAQLAFKVAAGGGGSFLNMFMHDQEGGPVLIYSAEDTFEDWERKAGAILCGCPDIDVPNALSRIHVVDKTEGIARLTEMVQLRVEAGLEITTRREPRSTPERLALIQLAKDIGARFIILETASRLVEEEDNSNFTALQAAGGHIASETGAAVTISHHPNKVASKDNDSSPEGARGGSALINNSRTAVSLFYAQLEHLAALTESGLKFAEEDVLVLEHQKGTSSVPKRNLAGEITSGNAAVDLGAR